MARYLFLSLTLLLSAATHANQKKPTITCVSNDFAPYFSKTEKGVTGLHVDIFSRISELTGIQFSLILRPWARAMADVKNGKYDCLFSTFDDPKRRQFLDYGKSPLHISTLLVFSHSQIDFTFTSIRDFARKKVGTVRGFVVSNEFTKLQQANYFTIVELTEVERAFRMLDKNRLDLVIFSDLVGIYYIQKLGLNNVTMHQHPLGLNPGYITFSKKSPNRELLPEIDSALELIKADGSYEEIINKYKM